MPRTRAFKHIPCGSILRCTHIGPSKPLFARKQSFLEQTPFRFLTIDLRVPGREVLTLDTFGTAGSSADERVRLVDPRRWGDPVKCLGGEG